MTRIILLNVFLIFGGICFVSSKSVQSHLPYQVKTTNDRNSRIFKFWKPFFSFQVEETEHQKKIVKCDELGGTLVLDKCYEYFEDEVSFDDAVGFCETNGGHLWIPRLDTPLFYNILMNLMPEISGASDETLWIGVTTDGDGVATTLEGDDVTKAFLVQINNSHRNQDLEEDSCLYFDFDSGSLHTDTTDCEDLEEFVCEYNIREVVKDGNNFSFNKYIYKLKD